MQPIPKGPCLFSTIKRDGQSGKATIRPSALRSMLDERVGDYASNDADWDRVSTQLNAQSRGIHGRVCFRGSRWQSEVERRATPAVAVGPDPAAMRFGSSP